MGQQKSKDKLLYQHVSHGNIEGIKSLRTDGADLEGKNNIGCLFWCHGHKWEVMVDLFFYREYDETNEQQEDDIPIANYVADYSNNAVLGGTDQWNQITDAQWVAGAVVEPVIPAVPVGTWTDVVAAGGWDVTVALMHARVGIVEAIGWE